MGGPKNGPSFRELHPSGAPRLRGLSLQGIWAFNAGLLYKGVGGRGGEETTNRSRGFLYKGSLKAYLGEGVLENSSSLKGSLKGSCRSFLGDFSGAFAARLYGFLPRFNSRRQQPEIPKR